MSISVLDLFSVGIGPSSSHTVGPMRAARAFTSRLREAGLLPRAARVRAELFGSLGATGKGHGSDAAVILGLMGHDPESVDTEAAPTLVARAREEGRMFLGGEHPIAFRGDDVVLHLKKALPGHPNALRLTALDAEGSTLMEREYYSVGGGFVLDEDELGAPVADDGVAVPYPFASGVQLLERCTESGLDIAGVMAANERVRHGDPAVRSYLLNVWDVMQECVENGCVRTETLLPGGLQVRRRAPELRRKLREIEAAGTADDPLWAMEWVNLYALAVNEENASGGRIVTAPTNGAAGILPSVLHYLVRFRRPEDEQDAVMTFLLTAGAIGVLIKSNASISGAEVGCQGEVGSAAAMAAAGLCAALGGTPQQVENAAEIALEHHLGMTCDPVGGLVQIPCIERNAIASVKAINAARLALHGDGEHHVSLDAAIETMRQTGRDMKTKYKETSRGGLAVNVVAC